MARSVMRHLRARTDLIAAPDVLDGQYLYPDGVAAAIVAAEIHRPYVLTARGTDVNVLARDPRVQDQILRAIDGAATTITVSASLRNALLDLGCDARRIVCLRNGVDLDLFRPIERESARSRLGITTKRVIASVGNLVPEKGHAVVIDALPSIAGALYVIVGDGPERARLERLAIARDVRERVLFLPGRPQSDLIDVYSAADVLVLPSTREGWPNVVLEALACGTPVVAADVGGIGELITTDMVGARVLGEKWTDFSSAILQVLIANLDRTIIRSYAERFGWGSIARAQAEMYRSIATGAGVRSSRDGPGSSSEMPRNLIRGASSGA